MLFPTGSGIPKDISMCDEWAPTSKQAFQQNEVPPKREYAVRDPLKIDDIVTKRARIGLRDSASLNCKDIEGAEPRMKGFRYNSLEGNITDSPQLDYYRNWYMEPPVEYHSRQASQGSRVAQQVMQPMPNQRMPNASRGSFQANAKRFFAQDSEPPTPNTENRQFERNSRRFFGAGTPMQAPNAGSQPMRRPSPNAQLANNAANFYGSTPQQPPPQVQIMNGVQNLGASVSPRANLNQSYDDRRRQRSPIGQDPAPTMRQDPGLAKASAAFYGATPAASAGRQGGPLGMPNASRGYVNAAANFYGSTPNPSVASSARNRVNEAFY